jgi:hypothetical protein
VDLDSRLHAMVQGTGDYLKLTTTAAAGALVLSLSLLPNAPTYSGFERLMLVCSWSLFAISALGGILALSAVPFIKYTGELPDLVRILVLVSNVALVSGALFMGSGLGHAFISARPFSSFAVRDGRAAIAIAEKALPAGTVVRKLDKVELVRGLDSTQGEDVTWNVQFEVDEASAPTSSRRTTRRTFDVAVAPDGRALLVEPGGVPRH